MQSYWKSWMVWLEQLKLEDSTYVWVGGRGKQGINIGKKHHQKTATNEIVSKEREAWKLEYRLESSG